MSEATKYAILIIGSTLALTLGIGIIASIIGFFFGFIELLKTAPFIYGGVVGIIIGVLSVLCASAIRKRWGE